MKRLVKRTVIAAILMSVFITAAAGIIGCAILVGTALFGMPGAIGGLIISMILVAVGCYAVLEEIKFK